MKKILLSIMAIAATCSFVACSNGDYLANPVTHANESVNPDNVLTIDQFSWGGTDAISCKINGVYYNVDSAHTTWGLDTAGYNVITGFTGIAHGLILRMKNVYGGALYNFGTLNLANSNNTLRSMIFYDSMATGPKAYSSAIGNIGQVYILQNDSSRIKGKFHFQALDSIGGNVINVSEGWFNVNKMP